MDVPDGCGNPTKALEAERTALELVRAEGLGLGYRDVLLHCRAPNPMAAMAGGDPTKALEAERAALELVRAEGFCRVSGSLGLLSGGNPTKALEAESAAMELVRVEGLLGYSVRVLRFFWFCRFVRFRAGVRHPEG